MDWGCSCCTAFHRCAAMLSLQMDVTLFQAITLAIAVLGAVLGLYNAWRNWIQDRVRVRVKLSFFEGNNGAQGITFEVVNLSNFPITITHFGFDLLGTDRHMQIPRPIFTSAETLPVRLASRTACTVLVGSDALPQNSWTALRNAYVNTACGLKIRGGHRFFNDKRLTPA